MVGSGYARLTLVVVTFQVEFNPLSCVIVIILLQDTSFLLQKACQSRVWTLEGGAPSKGTERHAVTLGSYRCSGRCQSFTPGLQMFFGVCMCF